MSIGWATKIRKANRMSIDDDIVVGQKLILPIDNTEEKKKFEDERIRYHLTIEEGFREKYAITGNSTYRVQRGDNYWSISKKLQVPLWLLSRYNPDLYKEPIKLGDVLNVPDIEPIEQP
ncbi:MAG: LysM peptidoglycan-binding domain-containing protein [Bdellovibrionota bacterium]